MALQMQGDYSDNVMRKLTNSGVGVFFLRQDEHSDASNWQRVAPT